MSEQEFPSSDMRELLALPPDTAMARVQGVHSTDFPRLWEYLRDGAVGKLQNKDLGDADRIAWAKFAALSISRRIESGEKDSLTSAAELARVRAYVIREFGPSSEEPFRNPDRLCREALEEIPMGYAEVRALAEEWKRRAPEEMLTLRRIKNLLTPLQDVADHLESSSSPGREIREWLDLIPLLP
ncbi:hypothetical protein [Streptomyces mesophilus]|uniref:hypothetical protein n=1 Tax=Streptomyces mesophilus TaxID=1775132 RepID=UPI00331D28F7